MQACKPCSALPIVLHIFARNLYIFFTVTSLTATIRLSACAIKVIILHNIHTLQVLLRQLLIIVSSFNATRTVVFGQLLYSRRRLPREIPQIIGQRVSPTTGQAHIRQGLLAKMVFCRILTLGLRIPSLTRVVAQQGYAISVVYPLY